MIQFNFIIKTFKDKIRFITINATFGLNVYRFLTIKIATLSNEDRIKRISTVFCKNED